MAREMSATLPSPWAEFFRDLDAALPEEVGVHCLGGFVTSLYYGLPRVTGDIDYYSVVPMRCSNQLEALAGEGSALARKYKVHVHHFAGHTMPEDWEDRLIDMFPRQFSKLRLYAPDPYDLMLSKLERNSGKDRDDAEFLARTCRLKADVLRERYEREMRPNLASPARHDLTLQLWIDSCFPATPPRRPR